MLRAAYFTTFAAFSVSNVFAADLPARMAAPVFSAPSFATPWTGGYVGATVGYNIGHTGISSTGTPVFVNPSNPGGFGAQAAAIAADGTNNLNARNSGFIGGGQVGYNYQFATSFVAGLEADIQGLTEAGTSNPYVYAPVLGFPAESFQGTFSASKRLTYLGTGRARLGYLVAPTILAYATGGVAYGQARLSASENVLDPVLAPGTSAIGAFDSSRTKVGFAVGAGVEWMLAKNISFKAEYLYYDLGSMQQTMAVTRNSTTAFPASVTNVVSSTRFNGSVARIGLNYHFNFDPPAVVEARY